MSADRAYKQAIKRVFGEKYPDKCVAVYWGRDDDTIHVLSEAFRAQNRQREWGHA
jgi:hypothetical protein